VNLLPFPTIPILRVLTHSYIRTKFAVKLKVQQRLSSEYYLIDRNKWEKI